MFEGFGAVRICHLVENRGHFFGGDIALMSYRLNSTNEFSPLEIISSNVDLVIHQSVWL